MTDVGLGHVGAPPRPTSVVWYERLAWAALAVGLGSTVASPATFAKYFDRYPIGYPTAIVVSFAIQFLWIWLIARKRQNWARWISLVFVLLGIPSMIWDMEERFSVNPAASTFFYASFAISSVSVMLLFRSDARDWFSRKKLAAGA